MDPDYRIDIKLDSDTRTRRTKWDTSPFWGHSIGDKIANFLRDNPRSTSKEICAALPTENEMHVRQTLGMNRQGRWKIVGHKLGGSGKKKLNIWDLVD